MRGRRARPTNGLVSFILISALSSASWAYKRHGSSTGGYGNHRELLQASADAPSDASAVTPAVAPASGSVSPFMCNLPNAPYFLHAGTLSYNCSWPGGNTTDVMRACSACSDTFAASFCRTVPPCKGIIWENNQYIPVYGDGNHSSVFGVNVTETLSGYTSFNLGTCSAEPEVLTNVSYNCLGNVTYYGSLTFSSACQACSEQSVASACGAQAPCRAIIQYASHFWPAYGEKGNTAAGYYATAAVSPAMSPARSGSATLPTIALTPQTHSSSPGAGAIVGIVIASLFAALCAILLPLFIFRLRRPKDPTEASASSQENKRPYDGPSFTSFNTSQQNGTTDLVPASLSLASAEAMPTTGELSTAPDPGVISIEFSLVTPTQSSEGAMLENLSTSPDLNWLPFSSVRGVTDVVDMDNLNFQRRPDPESTSFDTLPSRWHIPLTSISLLHSNGQVQMCGRGGFGVVLRAQVRKQDAAIKMVKGGDSREQAQFLHEISMLELCRSQSIVQFLGFSRCKAGLLLCMEYCAGGNLYDSLKRSKEFQWYNRGHTAMKSVAKGLLWLHELGISHQDLKSLNLLIDHHSEVKIADLGLGKLVSGRDTTVAQTGTLFWASPEQRMGCIIPGELSLASDVWAFSTVLYEVCTCRRPTLVLNIEEIEVPGEAPEELIKLIIACRTPNPAHRPTIYEVCEWLDEIDPS